MKLNNWSIALCALSLALLTGCSSEGEFRQSTGTSVALAGNNYKIIKTGATGRSSGFRFLGILPITSPTHSGAKASLYESLGIPLTGRSVALANATEDRSSLYLILFSIPRITVTADVVEFIDVPGGSSATPR